MNYIADNDSDEEEQLSLTSTGPSKSSQKPKIGKFLWDEDDSELEDSLANLNLNYDLFGKRNREQKVEKPKNKRNESNKAINSANTKIKQLLSDRLNMYKTAEENARKTGEVRRVRHLNREIQILNALVLHHDAGNIIDPDNIPPEIKIHGPKSCYPQLGVTFKESAEITVIPRFGDLESTSALDTDSEANLEKILSTLRLRRDQYKISVAQNKSTGNVPRALEHLSIIRMFDSVIKHLEMGEKVDLNDLPGPPDCPICHLNSSDKNQKHIEVRDTTANSSETSFKEPIISRSTVLQALQDRLRAYEISRMNAKKENNVGQALHMERIIKIYKEAIKLHRAGKTFPIEELPSPSGFAPIGNLKMPIKLPSKKLTSS